MRWDSSVVGDRVMMGDDIGPEMGDLAGEKGVDVEDSTAAVVDDEDFMAAVVDDEDFMVAAVDDEDFMAAMVEGEDFTAVVVEEDVIAAVVEDSSRSVLGSSSLSSLPTMSARWASFSCILAPATQWVSSNW